MSPTLRSLAFWCLNALAFWCAESLRAVAPTDGEPPAVLAAALGLYLAIAVLGWAGAWALRKLLPKSAGLFETADPWLAFAPWAVLLLPKLKAALGHGMAAALGVLVLSAIAAVLLMVILASGARRRGQSTYSLAAYFWGSLAVWLAAQRLSDLIIAAEVGSTRLISPWWLIGLLIAGGLIWALAFSFARLERRPGAIAALSALAILFFGLRFLLPPPFTPDWDSSQRPSEAGGATPVIVIVMDTTRADHLSLYGYGRETTPELEKLAEEAMVFDRAVAPSSWTLPSHASLFTGLFPLTHGALRLPWLEGDEAELEERGIRRPAYPLPRGHATLAEWFSENGYDTGAVMSNFAYLDPAFQVDQGFAYYDAWRNTAIKPRILEVIHRRVSSIPWAARCWQVYRGAEQINGLALEWLEGRRSDSVFLFLNYMEPHEPWGPHLPGLHYDRFAAEEKDPVSAFRGGELEPSKRRRIDLYDSQIASLDRALGQLFERLRELDLWEKSLVIVTSDHGESFGENGFDGHGKSLHEPEVAIPLLIKYPQSREVGRSRERVQLVDLWPTIAAELGLEIPEGLEGDPLGALDHPVLAELYTDPREPKEFFHGYRAALFEDDLKLIARSDRKVTIFDLEADPRESRDLSADHGPWSQEKFEELDQRRQLLEQAAWAGKEDVELDPEVEAGLKALGYL